MLLERLVRRFGQLALWLGLCEPRDLANALWQQRTSGRRLGEHLEADGRLTPNQTAAILDQQALLHQGDACVELGLRDGALQDAGAIVSGIRLAGRDVLIHVVTAQGRLCDPARLHLPVQRQTGDILILDLARVTHLNRHGAAALWLACGGRQVVFCAVPPAGQKALDTLGLRTVIPVLPDRRTAIDAAMAMARDWLNALPAPEDSDPEGVVRGRNRFRQPLPDRPAAPPLESHVVRDDQGGCCIQLRGAIQGDLSPLLAEAEALVAEPDCQHLILDLSEAELLDSDPLAMFVASLPLERDLYLVAREPIRQRLTQLMGPLFAGVFADGATLAAHFSAPPCIGLPGRTVYHRPGCRCLARSRRADLQPLSAAEQASRQPCAVCYAPGER